VNRERAEKVGTYRTGTAGTKKVWSSSFASFSERRKRKEKTSVMKEGWKSRLSGRGKLLDPLFVRLGEGRKENVCATQSRPGEERGRLHILGVEGKEKSSADLGLHGRSGGREEKKKVEHSYRLS